MPYLFSFNYRPDLTQSTEVVEGALDLPRVLNSLTIDELDRRYTILDTFVKQLAETRRIDLDKRDDEEDD